MTWFVDYGADLVANTDTLPAPIPEEVVMYKSRVYAYEWAEARKDVMAAKGSGANYALLMKEANGEFYNRLKGLRVMDKDVVDALNAKITAINGFGITGLLPWYNAQTGRSGMGWPWPIWGGR
jgi:hypothetical protein